MKNVHSIYLNKLPSAPQNRPFFLCPKSCAMFWSVRQKKNSDCYEYFRQTKFSISLNKQSRVSEREDFNRDMSASRMAGPQIRTGISTDQNLYWRTIAREGSEYKSYDAKFKSKVLSVTHQISRNYGIEGPKEGPQFSPHYAERDRSLSDSRRRISNLATNEYIYVHRIWLS